jgi:SAM-dependent methyltransferase
MFSVDDYCEFCNKIVQFTCRDGITSFREAECKSCGRNLRNNDVLHVIFKEFGGMEGLEDKKILNTSSVGTVHEKLKRLPNYICSDYFDDVPSGTYRNGILCADIMNLPFRDNSLDLVISEDIFEHIENNTKGFQEIARVLKKGGKHIFTVPICEGRATIKVPDEICVNHLDYLRPEGIKVVYDYGVDICSIVDHCGKMKTKSIMVHKFYEPAETTDLIRDYEEYKKMQDDLLGFFKYNSLVYVSTKKKGLFGLSSHN